MVDRNAIATNNCRLSYYHNVGDKVLLLVKDLKQKISDQAVGPFPITCVHTNGNVTIRRGPNVEERINIRRIKPYWR